MWVCGWAGVYECCAHRCQEIVSGPLELNLKAIVKCPMWIFDLFLISELCIQPQMQNKIESNPEKQKWKATEPVCRKGTLKGCPLCRRKQNHVESGNVKSAQHLGMHTEWTPIQWQLQLLLNVNSCYANFKFTLLCTHETILRWKEVLGYKSSFIQINITEIIQNIFTDLNTH